MKPELRVLLFVTAVGTVFVTAGHFLIAAVIRRLRKLPPPTDRAYILTQRAFVSLATLGVVCILYGLWVEPYWPEVTHVRIPTKKFAKGSNPIRVVHLSDLHSDPKPGLEEKLPAIIAAQKPDLIVFSGDATNSRWGMPVLQRLMGELSGIAPVYAAYGNWDVRENLQSKLYENTPVTVLNGEALQRDIKGQKIAIGGLSVDSDFWLRKVFNNTTATDFRLLVFHYPDRLEDAIAGGTDLYCAGHTHGGQVALPFYGALITMSRFDKKYEAGLYRESDTWMYVNRGIGMEGFAPRARFLSRPEITVIDIVPAE